MQKAFNVTVYHEWGIIKFGKCKDTELIFQKSDIYAAENDQNSR